MPAELRRWLPLAAVVAILLAAGAMMLARELISSDPPDPPPKAAAGTDGFVRFNDEAAAISIAHPAGWQRVASPDPEVRLLAEGDGSSMSMRIADLGIEVGPESLGAAKKLTDKLVRGLGQTKLLRPPQQISLSGLPGYLYLYTFRDAATGLRGAHAHYFLFRGQTLITIVFQTSPAQRFASQAPLFDRISETLRATPG